MPDLRRDIALESYCIAVRTAISGVKEKTILLKGFPYGCCRDSAVILGLYLIEKGYRGINYCHKQYDDDSISHGWIEVEGWILDLTADQFDLGYPAIHILPNSSTIPIYRNKFCEPCQLGVVSSDAKNLLIDYQLVMNELNRG